MSVERQRFAVTAVDVPDGVVLETDVPVDGRSPESDIPAAAQNSAIAGVVFKDKTGTDQLIGHGGLNTIPGNDRPSSVENPDAAFADEITVGNPIILSPGFHRESALLPRGGQLPPPVRTVRFQRRQHECGGGPNSDPFDFGLASALNDIMKFPLCIDCEIADGSAMFQFQKTGERLIPIRPPERSQLLSRPPQFGIFHYEQLRIHKGHGAQIGINPEDSPRDLYDRPMRQTPCPLHRLDKRKCRIPLTGRIDPVIGQINNRTKIRLFF